MPRSEVEKQFKRGSPLHLTGYTSTSQSMNVALKFAFSDDHRDCDTVPVVLEMAFRSSRGMLRLGEGCTAFGGEDEVLV